jgi:hypothetical protein
MFVTPPLPPALKHDRLEAELNRCRTVDSKSETRQTYQNLGGLLAFPPPPPHVAPAFGGSLIALPNALFICGVPEFMLLFYYKDSIILMWGTYHKHFSIS